MNQEQFDIVLNGLTLRRKEVLLKFLAGEVDEAIAQSLNITESTVRKHIEEICKEFKCEPDELRSKRPYLFALFRRCKPELVKECTPPVTSEIKAVETAEREDSSTVANSQDFLSTSDPNFVGRENAIADLNTLVSQGNKVILIQAEGGVGKTTLARHYLTTQRFDIVLELAMAKERKNITSVESVIEEWLKRDFDEEPGREFGITLQRLRYQLRDGSKKIGILIDNLEPALLNGRFVEEHRRYVELFRVLTDPDVQSITLITSREPIHENGICLWLYQLKELPQEAWNQFFEIRSINTSSSPLDNASALYQMHQAYGGNAEAMFVLGGAIQNECQGDLEAYWQENRDDLLINPTLKNPIKNQFDKLKQDDEPAYRLLCRLGCFRYQDVPSVPKEGIFYLLWDVPELRRKRVVNALRERSLIKVFNDEYYLHPVIRAEAINRLRESEDWETANRKAAEFWTESVKTVETVEDALTAFEAYYHCLEISDFELACNVILKRRDNPLLKADRLGRSFYRFGLTQKMIVAITLIVNQINLGYKLGALYSILGVLYRVIGQVNQALECHEKSGLIARECLKVTSLREEIELSDLKLEVFEISELNSLLNIGFCQIELWEIEAAEVTFTKLQTIAFQKEYSRESINITLAFVKSCLGFKQQARELAEKVYSKIDTSLALHTGYRLFFLGLTYKNLGDLEKALKIYNFANLLDTNNLNIQVKAKILYGIAELYRINKEFKTALSHHSESIELLEKIGAKCDLAEAYYQLGLTYQKMSETENSQENFDKAIQLFSQMEAPKQVEKVQQAIVSGE